MKVLSEEEIARRRWVLEQAIHSNRMEGLEMSAAGSELFERYVRGEIDVDELVQLMRSHYGVE
ncbi:antitoxin VbhA family protein [Trueperella pyogenes]